MIHQQRRMAWELQAHGEALSLAGNQTAGSHQGHSCPAVGSDFLYNTVCNSSKLKINDQLSTEASGERVNEAN